MRRTWMLGVCGLAATTAFTLAVSAQDGRQPTNNPGHIHQNEENAGSQVLDSAAVQARFLADNPGVSMLEIGGRIERVYGRAFSHGQSPHDSAERFLLNHAQIWGVPAADLVARGPFEDGRHLQPIMFENGQPKFTGVYYTQERDGVEVFRSRLTLLVRNVPNHPLVLASADLRNLGDFQVDAAVVGKVNDGLLQVARNRFGGAVEISNPRQVIWAGVEGQQAAPRLADECMVIDGANKWLLLSDSATGELLYDESLICFGGSVSGNAAGVATQGIGADFCENETATGMPYLRVTSGAATAVADAAGNFVINPGAGTITATPSGMWFEVFNFLGAVETVSVPATTPANLLFNSANSTEQVRAQTNAYIEANRVRDYTLQYNPAYPDLQDTDFPVTVNRTDGFCPGNAWYDPGEQSINFCLSGGGSPNTSWSSVIHHEYGHRLVNAAGSGQGAYGEGMGDVMSVLILDHPCLGQGFFGNCNECLRNADNNCQYQSSGCSSCGSEIHDCGQLISGCVWDLRNNLLAIDPADYRDIVSNLAINSMLVHSGSSINPGITIDYLTLDDDDADMENGTPHRPQIAAAFGVHNMDAPPLLLAFTYPNGRPEFVSPNGTTLLRVVVNAGDALPTPGATLHVDTGGGFDAIAMTQVAPNTYEAAFPSAACGEIVRYYVSAQTTGAATATSPAGAPAAAFTAISASGLGIVAFEDDFQNNLGWTINSSAADGQWTRGVPITGCDRGNPQIDGDGSGACYLTDNSGANFCNSDVDDGSTTLTSPVMDASAGESVLSYWRWYSNTQGGAPNADTFVVEISSNGGSSWQTLETVGPEIESDGGWFFKQFSLGDVPGFALTDQFRIRFVASDLGSGSVVEAAVDGVKLQQLVCDAAVPGDVDGDGDVDVDDLVGVILGWGCTVPPGPCPADVDGSGVVDVDDLIMVILNWG